ncbi:P-loop containing nucleoside triphosphate hydrolase protein [Catenaria anguillulae PL171]|uniref:p-loop containing nucleoside triphosphate hydrolase protein n=1 Tax=Catenaria anguillulae PL171 TaxID=765915 RepID=A0A1Y2HMS0_9FUNG|nr:P-loop containing nucleoside triphosphate hydrolase protein [Catenaria anguillulae PL171]
MAEQQVNIQVFVRCRPKNDREIANNVPDVLHVPPAGKSKDIEFTDARGATKKYTFDQVFSPLASQAIVYKDVVEPIVKEVLKGFNCTIFAYGQTGTGKTHTMEGNINFPAPTTSAYLPPLPDDAGMIPRALKDLFDRLAMDHMDYTVKLSCMELYQEELYDLLAPTPGGYPPPPPLSSASSSSSSFKDAIPYPKLDLNTDRTGTVVIKNLEECLVDSAPAAMRLVMEAGTKRKKSGTALNAFSSRSHCIFTITVFMRETTLAGEELVKTGKLNLVDLAGSENISRSKAQDQQVREAGAINKSLLNLGRVINALVRREAHVPYRESKLTRILQESLGGRAKTAIIATVSPATNNVEETQSTLEYAHRAKNIQNKPEANTRVNKKVLMAEYTHEITHLKQQLQAARDRNGTFLTPEFYAELVDASEKYKVLKEQHVQVVEGVKAELKAEREAHAETRGERDRARRALAEARCMLEERGKQVKQLDARVKEDRLVLMAVSQREHKLREVMHEMAGTIEGAAKDVQGLHATVEMARQVVKENNGQVQGFGHELVTELKGLKAKLDEFEKVQCNVGEIMRGKVERVLAGFGEYHDTTNSAYDALTDRLGSYFAAIDSHLHTYSQHEFTAPLRDLVSTLRTDLTSTMDSFHKSVQASADQHTADLDAFASAYQSWHASTESKLTDVFSSLSAHFASQHNQLAALSSAVAQFAHDTQTQLSGARELAQKDLDDEMAKTRDMANALLDEVSTLITGFVSDRTSAWTAHAEAADDVLREALVSVDKFSGEAKAGVAKMVAGVREHGEAKVSEAVGSSREALVHGRALVDAAVAKEVIRKDEAVAGAVRLVETVKVDVVDQVLPQLESRMHDMDAARAEVVAKSKDEATAAGQVLASATQALRQGLTSARDAIVEETNWWKQDTMVDNCKQLVTGFTARTQSLETAVEHLTRKRLREPEAIPVPNKRQHRGPSPDRVPAPLNRSQILAQRHVAKRQHSPSPGSSDGMAVDEAPLSSMADPVQLVEQLAIDVGTPARPSPKAIMAHLHSAAASSELLPPLGPLAAFAAGAKADGAASSGNRLNISSALHGEILHQSAGPGQSAASSTSSTSAPPTPSSSINTLAAAAARSGTPTPLLPLPTALSNTNSGLPLPSSPAGLRRTMPRSKSTMQLGGAAGSKRMDSAYGGSGAAGSGANGE